jgi:preprotein translocase subunit YajC
MQLPQPLLLLSAPPPGGGQTSIFITIIPYLLIFAIFYFLMIVPARKKQKAHTAMVEGLKPGDKIVTNGGIYGTVVGVTDSIVQVRIADQVKIEIAKNAVAGMQERTE